MKPQEILSRLSNLETNMGTTERVVSVLSGSVLLYDAIAKKTKSMPGALLAGFMIFRGATGYCPGYDTLSTKTKVEKTPIINIKIQMTIDRPVSQVYPFWRDLENLPLFMEHLESVVLLDEETSEWKVKIPGNIGHLAWKAAIIKDEENREISWRSFSDSIIHNIGKVQFYDNGKSGTKMQVMISYQVPLGKIGETAAKVLNPIFENMIEKDIKRFKDYIENQQPRDLLPTSF